MTGLIVEGGASRTVYAAGVMDALLTQNVVADYFIGVSAGIAFGVSYCSGQIGRNLSLIKDYMSTPEYSGAKHLLNPKNKSFYNLDYVYGEVPQKLLPFDFEAFENFKGKCVSVMTNLETGEAEYPDTPRNDSDFTYLRASCALPLLFPPIEIDGKKYMDGGISDSIPFKQAMKEGCDKIIVILSRERGYVKYPESSQRLVLGRFRHYPQFCEQFVTRAERYNQSIDELEQLRLEGKAFVFCPKKQLLVKRTENDPQKLNRLYDYGYNHAMWAKESLEKYLGK
jgi:predicted patatin/cPLA2 family phospholipase